MHSRPVPAFPSPSECRVSHGPVRGLVRPRARRLHGILWLASYPKSGNTWMRAFLANHFRGGDRPVPINRLPDYAIGDNFRIHYERVSGRPAATIGEEEARRLRPLVHHWFAVARGETAIVKTHSLLGEVDGAPLITPEVTAGVLYIVRNPLDVAVSFAHHYQTDYERAVEAVCRPGNFLPPSDRLLAQYIGSWSEHVRSWTETPGLRRLVVRYEDMLQRPVRTFEQVVRFLGLPEAPARLRRAIRFSSFEQLRAQEQREGFVEARPDRRVPFFRSGRRGVWRRVLTREQVARIVDAHGPVMRRFGYLDDRGRPRA